MSKVETVAGFKGLISPFSDVFLNYISGMQEDVFGCRQCINNLGRKQNQILSLRFMPVIIC